MGRVKRRERLQILWAELRAAAVIRKYYAKNQRRIQNVLWMLASPAGFEPAYSP